MKYPVPENIRQFASIFRENGHRLYIVGGAVRDHLLGRKNSDYDFCTDAKPEEVIPMFRRVIPTGIKHGTVTVLFKGDSFEVTTFRTEGAYSDQRHPDSVTFVTDLSEDLSRRDFTVNAFAADCLDGSIIDLFDGMKDLKAKTIRAIGNPRERFEEDALRLMRLARFCSKLGFEPDPDTKQAATQLSASISNVSQERIYDELSKILMTEKPTVGLRLLEDIGVLEHILPELTECRRIEQTKVGATDVLEHIYNTVDAAAHFNYSYNVRLAALLHDIAKPQTMIINPYGIMRFFGHDIKSAQMARVVMRRLKCSNQLTDTVCNLIENHMVKYRDNWTDGAVKRFIKRVGKENINELFELQWCDQIASEGKSKVEEYDPFIRRIKELENQPMSVKDLAVSGDDLAQAGIPKSKVMGQILDELLEMVIDYPTLNEKETLINQAILLYKNK
ncbi:MAG: CCA tRNA nucleotidyltransferase [Spirochaetales bacterium]|nr:CCA tRNA nucleotidyltransferase [Spirochaetales bacterium]MBR5669266.1 CCA tRNA nucleotidyltransferase [Spirochaetales bacterium]